MGKDIQFEKLLVNYIRDDVAIFEQGDVNILETYVNLYSKLKDLEDTGYLTNGFETGNNSDISKDIENLKKKIINHYEGVSSKFYTITGDDTTNIKIRTQNVDILDFLKERNITIPDYGDEVKNKLIETAGSPNLGIKDEGDESEKIRKFKYQNYKTAYIQLRTEYPKLKEHYTRMLEALLQSFPNINIVNFSRYLNDYNRCKDLDIIRKLEVLDETQKILGEISNIVLHEGINLGVVDFNLTKDYLYMNYLSPSAVNTVENGITPYNWEGITTDNVIQSLSLVSVRLNKDYLDEVFKNNYGLLHTLRYIDKETYGELIQNEIEEQIPDTITLTDKVLTLYEKDEEGIQQKTLRENLNIGEVFYYQ